MLISVARATSFTSLLCIAIVISGCGASSSAPPDLSKIATLDPAISSASSNSLLDLFHKLNDVYEAGMIPTIKKIEPEEKSLVAKLKDGKDVKAQLAKDHKLFEEGIEAAKQTMMDLSNSTSTAVDPMEHDKYVAYYTSLGEILTARQDEYEEFLAYEAKPTDANRMAVLDTVRIATGKELSYKMLKR